MKKITILALILIASILLSSCQAPQSRVYSFAVCCEFKCASTLDLGECDRFSRYSRPYNNENAEKTKVENFFGKNYTLTYQSSTESYNDSKSVDIYYDEASDCTFSYSIKTGNLLDISPKDFSKGVVVSPEAPLLNIDAYLLWIAEVIDHAFGIDVNEYTFQCETRYRDHSSEESFVLPNQNTEKEVSDYFLEYNRYIDGYQTADYVGLKMLPDGSIVFLRRSEMPSEVLEKLTVDEAKLNRTIKKTMSEIRPDMGKFKSYSTKNMRYIVHQGHPTLEFTLNITGRIGTLKDGYDEGSWAIAVMVFLDS